MKKPLNIAFRGFLFEVQAHAGSDWRLFAASRSLFAQSARHLALAFGSSKHGIASKGTMPEMRATVLAESLLRAREA